MPLVLVVLAIAVLISVAIGAKKKDAAESKRNAYEFRKTNAHLEQEILDGYIKHGYAFDVAYKRTAEDMAALGFEPCIPKSNYISSGNPNCHSSIYRKSLDSYDSKAVHRRKKNILEEWELEHKGEKISDEELSRLTYLDFPKSDSDYEFEIVQHTYLLKTIPIDGMFVHPKWGTCVVCGYECLGNPLGYYKAKVLKNGLKISVSFKDTSITRIY